MTTEPGSEANVDVVLRTITLFADGKIDEMRPLYDDAAIVTAPPGWPEPGPYVGKDAVMSNWAHIQEDWAEQEMTVVSTDARGEVVLVEMTWDVVGRASGLRTHLDLVGVYRVRDGLVVEAGFFLDRASALEALGWSD